MADRNHQRWRALVGSCRYLGWPSEAVVVVVVGGGGKSLHCLENFTKVNKPLIEVLVLIQG